MMGRIPGGVAAITLLVLIIPSSPVEAWQCVHRDESACTTATTIENEDEHEDEGHETPRCPCDTTTTTREDQVGEDSATSTTTIHDMASPGTTTTQMATLIPPAVIHKDRLHAPQRLEQLPVTGNTSLLVAGGVLLTMGGAATALGKRRSFH